MARSTRSRTRRGPLPKGAGKVHCLECDVWAAADGKGSPIVLKHLPWCSEHPDNLPSDEDEA